MSDYPANVWVRANEHDNGCQATLGPAPDAVRYVRADLYEVAMRAALESAEDNDVDGVERILRTALKPLPEADYPR